MRFVCFLKTKAFFLPIVELNEEIDLFLRALNEAAAESVFGWSSLLVSG